MDRKTHETPRKRRVWAAQKTALTLAALLVACLLPFTPVRAALADTSAADASGASSEALHFGADGSFTVLLLADCQDTQWTVPYLLNSIHSVLEEYTPDLVVLLGDQLEGGSPLFRLGNGEKNVAAAIDTLMQPIVSRGIPFALVFGNHDGEAPMREADQMALYQSYAHCLAIDEGDALPGCGTYLLPVYGAADAACQTPLLNLYFFDSGSYLEDGGYACVTSEQVDWYRAESARVRAENGNQSVPAVAFQHIVVAEIYDALDEAQKDAPGAFAGKGYGAERFFLAESAGVLAGEINEAPCPSAANNGQFDAFKESGDVFAAFFGHDHVNTFLVGHEGIDLVASPGASYTSYNDRAVRGVRLVRFSEDNVRDYETLLVPFAQYETISLFGVIPYYLLSTTRVYNAVKLLALALIVCGGLLAIVLLDRKQRKAREKAQAADGTDADGAEGAESAADPDAPQDAPAKRAD